MKQRGKEHTSLTETATLVVHELKKLPGITMIAPGEIRTTSGKNTGSRFITVTYTKAGCELLIAGQAVQKVAVHTTNDPKEITRYLKQAKKLQSFTVKERTRMPGV